MWMDMSNQLHNLGLEQKQNNKKKKTA